jgi:ribosomal protein S18 acetylase RimI-like enzyme
MLQIALHAGPRHALATLFAEADDSASEIASYRDLGDLLVARNDETVVGLALIVETEEAGVFELKSLAVGEAWRSCGIGSALVTAVVQHCRQQGGQLLRVATAAASIRALQFYQRQGFRFRHIIRDFYGAERGYRPLELNGIPLLDEIIFDLPIGADRASGVDG